MSKDWVKLPSGRYMPRNVWLYLNKRYGMLRVKEPRAKPVKKPVQPPAEA